jgi:hypothetical protein
VSARSVRVLPAATYPLSLLPELAADLMRVSSIQSRQQLPYASSRSSRCSLAVSPDSLQGQLGEIGVPPQRGGSSVFG